MQLVTRTVRVLFTCSRQVTEHTRVLYLGNKFLYLVSPFGAARTLTSSIIIIIFIVVVLNFRRFELTPNSSLGPKRTRPVEPEVVLCSLSPFSFCVCIIHHTCMEFDRFFAVVLQSGACLGFVHPLVAPSPRSTAIGHSVFRKMCDNAIEIFLRLVLSIFRNERYYLIDQLFENIARFFGCPVKVSLFFVLSCFFRIR